MELSARSAYRGQVTKIVKSAGEFLASHESQLNKEDALDGIEEELITFIERLTAAHGSLLVTNQEVKTKDLIKAEDMERDFEKVAEYEDSAIGMLARLNSRLKKLRRTLYPTITKTDESSHDHNKSAILNSSMKLQKLSLKKFDGNFQEWLPFWEQFKTAVHENNCLTSSDKFSYLESVLVGNAKKVIAGFTASEMCYDAAVSLLQEQFGDTERLVDKYMQDLISLRPIHSRTDVSGLRNLYNAITACSRTLTALQVPPHQYYVMLKSILLRCLPVELRIDFHRTAEREKDVGETDTSSQSNCSALSQIGDKQVQGIMRFLKREVESLEKSRVAPLTANSKQLTPTTATSLVSMSEKDACLFCTSEQHGTKDCDANIAILQKRDKLRTSGRCFRCAKRGHSSKQCRSAKWLSCKKCKGKHLTSLCDPSFTKKPLYPEKAETVVPKGVNKVDNQNALNLCACNSVLENSNVFLKTARGIAVALSENKSVLIRFIVDGGSQHSYIRESLVQKLGLTSIGTVNMTIIPFGSKEESPARILNKVKIAIESQFSRKRVYIEAVVVPEICVDVLPAPESSCYSFQGLRLADLHHVAMDTEVGLSVLIGSDFYWAVVTGKQRRITASLRAIETVFGWTLQGSHSSSGKTSSSNIHLCSSSLLSVNPHLPVLNDNDIKSFWALEAIGIRSEEAENQHTADQLIANCISKRGLRYEATLPWKDSQVLLMSNRQAAENRSCGF